MFKNLSPSALGISGHQSEIIELALTFGFQGLDIDVSEFATRVKLHGAAYARRLTDSAKLRLASFDLPVDLESDDATYNKRMQKLAEYAHVAAEVGCRRCLAVLAPASADRPYHENFEFHRRRLADVAGTLAQTGLRLGVGFRAAEYLRRDKAFQFIHDLDALQLLLNMVSSQNVGLLIDLWELQASGVGIERLRSLKAEQIVAVEVANMPIDVAPAELSENARMLPGEEGAIDVPAALLMLAEMGYQGPVTAKPSQGRWAGVRRDQIVKAVGESLTKVWKAAGLSPAGKLAPQSIG